VVPGWREGQIEVTTQDGVKMVKLKGRMSIGPTLDRFAKTGMKTNFGLSAAVRWCDPQIRRVLTQTLHAASGRNSGLFLF
jgi:hypothetical protein